MNLVWRYSLYNLQTSELVTIYADEPHKVFEEQRRLGLGPQWQPVFPLRCGDWTPDDDGKLIVYDQTREPIVVSLALKPQLVARCAPDHNANDHNRGDDQRNTDQRRMWSSMP